jgi:hypothetical protein
MHEASQSDQVLFVELAARDAFFAGVEQSVPEMQLQVLGVIVRVRV